MARRVKIDSVDIKIIELLSKNSRLTYKELAELLGTTRQRVSRRMEKLERLGIIKRYTILPDYDALGYSYVILGITLKAGANIDEITEKLKDKDHVKVIQKALGTHNLVIHLVVPKEMKEIQRIIEEIGREIDGIEHMDVTFITENCKYETF